ncbi:hypothetical protein BH10PSE7_BH10PSE7_30120 [soil metagenome]
MATSFASFRYISIVSAALAGVSASAAASPVPGTSCPTFPADTWWHADVSGLPVHPKSAAWLSRMSPDRNLHPDFGPSFGEQPVPYGIPITVVGGGHAKVRVQFQYDDESNDIPYPLGNDTKVEGGQYRTGDRHTVIVDKSTCRLYETWATARSNGSWQAGSGANWKLDSYFLRDAGDTSADAAGLPILPLLLRFDEVAAGEVDHAIRFTTDTTDRRYLWPARHQAGSVSNQNFPPMGARFRLKASYKIKPGLRAGTKTVLQAMKKYGLVLADNGSPWFFQGTSDTRWSAALIEELKGIPASAFEAVDTSPLMVTRNSMRVKEFSPNDPANESTELNP